MARFLNPCIDWVFKRIFGSPESEKLLIGFLNDCLHDGRPVVTAVTVLDPYLPSKAHLLKDSVVDLRARLADGTEVLIEMQMFPVASFCQRVLYNAAKCLTAQLGRGQNYGKLRPVHVITVADCVLLPKEFGWHSRFALRERHTGRPFPDASLDFTFLQLPAVDPAALPALHPLRDWLRFLKNATAWRSIPRDINNPAVRQAIRLARRDSLSPQEQEAMTKRELYRIDQINMKEFSRREGIREGIREARLENASRMIAAGLPEKLISECTGLTPTELKPLLARKRRARKARTVAA